MTLPVYKGHSAIAASTGALTPTAPAAGTIAVGDWIFIQLESSVTQTSAAAAAPSGYVEAAPAKVSGSTAATCLTLWMKRATVANETIPSVGDYGDHTISRVFVIGGADPVNPVDASASTVVKNNATGANYTATWPSVTTTVSDTLILLLCNTGLDIATAQVGPVTNSGIFNPTERYDDGSITGNGGTLALITAERGPAGAIGTSTATIVGNATTAHACVVMTLAIKAAEPVTVVTGGRNRRTNALL